MKIIGLILALALFAGILFGLGYGLMQSWAFISQQWSVLEAGWKPVVILLSSVIFFCTLLLYLLVRSSFSKTLNAATGKTMAYNDYINWYVDADSNNYADTDLETIRGMRNEFLLWAGNNVVKQLNHVLEELEKEDSNSDDLKKYANNTYIEIQRELGRRGGSALRQI